MEKDIKTAIPIVLAFTPSYFVPAATCLLSVLDHAPCAESFHVICLLSEPLGQKVTDQLYALDPERLRFTFVDMHGKLNEIYVDERYTVAASYRLLLPELLPEYNKVIYMDCDVIVRNNIADLYRATDLYGLYMAGVFEATLDSQHDHMQAIGCTPGRYINSGFLLMNLELLRRDTMVPKFLQSAQQEGLQFPDQDVINQLCAGRIVGLAPYYNAIRTYFLPQYKTDFLRYYSLADWKAVRQHGTVHYTGSKPWNSITVMFTLWWTYFEKLPQEVKNDFLVTRKYYRIFRLYNTPILGGIIELAVAFYRTVRYRLK